METIASHKYANSSAQKLRLVANLIRGEKAIKALEILNFSKKKASFIIKKVLNSAISNANHNKGIKSKYLKISKIFVDSASNTKRVRLRAKGKSDRIIKRKSHITIILSSI